MININDENFVTDFKMSEGCVGQIGYGFIGKAVEQLFKPHCKVLVYDKYVPGTNTLEEVLAEAQVVFIAVPTPMDKFTGECHTAILESVIQDIQRVAVEINRDLEDFVVVIKSTIPPGFTRKMQNRHALRILFSPEFLTEANAVDDFKNARRVILGGELDDARVVFKYFEGVWPMRVKNDQIVIAQCEPECAEMVKLTTNALLMTRVLFMNEIWQICQKIGVEWNELVPLLCLDPRINHSHMKVPGPDGKFGAGGSCFPKDIHNLRHVAKTLGIEEKLFTAVIEKNEQVRPEKDWENLKGRAVVDGK